MLELQTVIFDPSYLDNTALFSPEELHELHALANSCAAAHFYQDKALVDYFALQFSSAAVCIEAAPLSPENTRAMVLEERVIEPSYLADIFLAVNAGRSIRFLSRTELTLSLNSCCRLHRVLSSCLLPERECGSCKIGDNYLSDNKSFLFKPMFAGVELDEAVERMFENCKALCDPFAQALYLHDNIIYLQYFADCNKRTARAAMLLPLKAAGLMPMMLLPESDSSLRERYQAAIKDYLLTGSHHSFARLFLEHYRALAARLKTMALA